MIRDVLNLQGRDLSLLEDECSIYLWTKKKRKLEVRLIEDKEDKNGN